MGTRQTREEKGSIMNIVVITQAHCTSCTKVRELLADNGLSAVICSLSHQGSTELRRFMKGMNITTVPAVFVDGRYIGGYEDTASLFDTGEQYSFGEQLDP